MAHRSPSRKPRAQSAIEFLMTYGWAILVIAVIIGLLFQLGVFSPSLPNSCISGAPFFCNNPLLYSNGTLAVQIGELGSTLTVTNLNCTASSAPPTVFIPISSVRMVSGAISTLRFACPLTSDSVGSSFSGRLWIYYGTPTQTGLEAQVGTFTATVMGVGVPTNSVAQQYALTMISGAGGYVLPPSGNYSGSVGITAVPNEGYSFAGWTGSGPGSYAGPSNPSTVNMGGHITEAAAFALQSYSFSAAAGAGGSVACSYSLNGTPAPCSATYPYGTQITVAATPSSGYILSDWNCTGSACSPSSTSPTSVTVLASNVTVRADFSTPPYFLWVAAGTGGTVSCVYASNAVATTCAANYSAGTQITATANPGAGYSFSYWTCDPADACSNAESNPVTVIATSDPLAIANFASHAYAFAASAGAGGSVTCAFAASGMAAPCSASYSYGTQIIINAIPAAGNSFSGWSGSGGGSYTGASDPVTVTVTDAISETAQFGTGAYSFAATNSTAGGIVACTSDGVFVPCVGNYASGTVIAMTATPDSGYVFSGWTGSGAGSYTGASDPASATVLGATTESAAFTTQLNSLSATAGSGGSVSCAYASNGFGTPCTGSYARGTQIAITALPASGYTFSNWTCTTGACSTLATSPTTATLTASANVVANFAVQAYTFTALAGTGGSVSCAYASNSTPTPCSGNYAPGTAIVVNATPGRGYSFLYWTCAGGSCSTTTSSPVTVTLGSAQTSVTATFAVHSYFFSAYAGPGGSVTCTSGGVIASCAAEYPYETQFIVTATPNAGYAFNHWSCSVACSPTSVSPTTLTLADAMANVIGNFTVQSYPLSATAGTGGSVSCAYASNGTSAPCAGSYLYGTQIRIAATPDPGHLFTGWVCTSGACSTLATSPTTATVSSAVNVTANFATQNFTFVASAGTGGSVSCAYASNSAQAPCSADYPQGTQIVVTASPGRGYSFVDWTCSAGSCSTTTSSPTTATSGASATSVVANFAIHSYLFVATAGTGGTVSCESAGATAPCVAYYPYATQFSIVAVPAAGYAFSHWVCSVACSPTSITPTALTLADAIANVTANFTIQSYLLSATAGADGSVSCAFASNGTATPCSGSYPYGTQITVTATPESSYVFTGWTCTAGSCSTISSSPTTVTVSANTSVAAAFASQQDSFSATAGTGGSVSCAYSSNSVSTPCSGTYAYGTQIAVTAIPGTGYSFTSWTCTASACSATASPSINITATSATSAVANFAVQSYLFFATNATGGTVSCTVGGAASPCFRSYPYGTQITVTAAPSTGYALSNWTCAGSPCSPTSSSPTRVTLGAAATSVVPKFAIQSYSFSATNTTGGTVSCSPACPGTYQYGTQITVSATPGTGYLFSGWTCTGSPCSPAYSSPTTVTLGAAPSSAVANFAAQPYSFSATAGSGGSVSCAYSSNSAPTPCSSNYTFGTSILVSASPSSGYSFASWTCNPGAACSASASNVLVTVGSGTTAAYANFAEISYSFAANAVPAAGGSVSCSGRGTSCSTSYPYGAQETVTAYPASGYSVTGWTCTGAGVSCPGTGAAQTVTIPTGGATMTADFAPQSYSFAANAVPAGAGTVSCSGGGATSCSAGTYTYGNTITVTASPTSGNVFAGWTCNPGAACSASNSVATVTIPAGGVSVSAGFQPNLETLAVGNNGCASVAGAGSYAYGSSDQFSANVQTGYSFAGWVGAGSGSYTGTANPASVTLVNSITETALCTISSYSFSANAFPAADGTVSCSGQGASCDANYPYGSHETVTVTPASNYSVTGWTCAGSGVTCTGAGTAQTVAMPVGGASFTADLARSVYPFTANAGPGGTITCNGLSCSAGYASGSQIAVAAMPSNGYTFSGLSCAPSSACSVSGANALVTMPVNGVTVTASFYTNLYAFTASYGTGGSVTCNGLACQSSYASGSQVAVAAAPTNGYSLSGLSCAPSSACSISGSNALVTMPAGAVTVTASFTANAYAFTANAGIGGAMTCNGVSCLATYPYNAHFTAAAVPANGYSLSGLSCAPSSACSISGRNAIVTMPIGGLIVTASFTANTYAFTSSVGAGGAMSCNGLACSATYPYNSQIAVAATPALGYSLSSLACTPSSACSISGANALVTLPVGGVAVNALFAANAYAFSANVVPSGEGTVYCLGDGATTCLPGNYLYAGVIVVNATSNSGYTFSGWTCNPSSACSTLLTTPTQVTVPINGVTVQANFATQSFSFYAAAGTGGTVSCSGAGTSCNANYPFNSVETVTATPISGNAVLSWTCTGVTCLGTGTTQTIQMPANAVNIQANFGKCYPLTLIDGTGGSSVSASPANTPGCPAGNFLGGSVVTLTATATTGNAFSSWSGNFASTSNPWTTFTMPTGPASETATYTSTAVQLSCTSGSSSTPYITGNCNSACLTAGWPNGGVEIYSGGGCSECTTFSCYGQSWDYISTCGGPGGCSVDTCNCIGPPAPLYSLTTSVSPAGAGTVTPASNSFRGTVPITATSSSPNSIFNGWIGTGTGSYTGSSASASVQMSSNIVEVANFTVYPSIPLSCSYGSYTDPYVTSPSACVSACTKLGYSLGGYSPSTGSCAGTCQSGSCYGQTWDNVIGGCGGPGGCIVDSCYCIGTRQPIYTLTVNALPSGAGTTSPSVGNYSHALGDSVTLTESPATDYAFTGWTGTGTGSYTGNSLTANVVIGSNVVETADFSVIPTTTLSCTVGSTTAYYVTSSSNCNTACVNAGYSMGGYSPSTGSCAGSCGTQSCYGETWDYLIGGCGGPGGCIVDSCVCYT